MTEFPYEIRKDDENLFIRVPKGLKNCLQQIAKKENLRGMSDVARVFIIDKIKARQK